MINCSSLKLERLDLTKRKWCIKIPDDTRHDKEKSLVD